ncbi:hypothetical protein [Butyricimonas sp. Marseille-P3923]|uniref:hypothetical protein n=1 Tax=Butyricimonas sp. Marseille-P3923 TaxID=1987504 RepID=UPI000C06DA53|nr:hypothetical protein [Butyricimonas sp. Marseille-P3923]
MKFTIFIIFITIIFSCGKNENNSDCFKSKDVNIKINTIPFFTAYIGEKCLIIGEVNKPLTMQIFVDSIKIGKIFQKDTLTWIPEENKFKLGEEHYIHALVYVCAHDKKGETEMIHTQQITISKRNEN